MRFVASVGAAVVVGLVGLVACAPPEDPAVSGRVENQKTPDPTFDAGGGGGSTQTVACAEGDFAKNDSTEATCPTWADIYTLISVKWNCTLAACHGETTPTPPYIPADSTAAFKKLAMYTDQANGVTKPYINPCEVDESKSAFTTSINKGGSGAGKQMPPGTGATADDLAKVKAWVACGAPGPK